ncbi:class I tRNA ligase family protein [Candidatus Woesearchaeota archaeon]|nr:class I tRNA ligase family protein [Candidatus Woesearchaeota archaeon]
MNKLKGDYIVIDNLKGSDLVGLEYESFYPDIEVQRGIRSKVISFDEVGEKDGTGIVHIAPNCGDIDYELGKKLNLKILGPALDDFGNYNEGYGWLTGRNVKEVKKEIVSDLDKRGLLYAVENYKHRYPICWRCKEELVFRLDYSWFISCDEIRPIMKKEASKVEWYPEHVGKLMQDWLDNMEDWNISRKRYWGLPLMFFECNACQNIEVIGSLKELREKAVNKKEVDNLPELHRPWIDKITIKCKCGEKVERIKEVGDCWLDAGIVPFSTLKYFEDKKYWKKWFPAELEIEMRAQVRLWFYAQLFMSVVLEGVAPYKRILAYEEVRDEKGEPMHKSKGNAIWFNEAVERMGADVMRWQYCSQNPQFNLNFGYGPAKKIKGYLLIIQNLANYIKQNCNNTSKTYSKDLASLWILSRRENLKLNVTKYLDNLEYHKAIEGIKNFLLFDLSKTYVQFIRDELHDPKVQSVLYDSYFDAITLLAPFLPFITEKINLDVYKKESIHLQPWPKADTKLINEELENSMNTADTIIQNLLALREKAQFGVRWPLKEAMIKTNDKVIKAAVEKLNDLIKRQTNIKKVSVVTEVKGLKSEIKPDFNKLGPVFKDKTSKIITAISMISSESIMRAIEKKGIYKLKVDKDVFDIKKEYLTVSEALPLHMRSLDVKNASFYINTELTPDLESEGFYREVTRRIQDLRKKAGLKKKDKIELVIRTLYDDLEHWKKDIQEKTSAFKILITNREVDDTKYTYKIKEKIRLKEFELMFNVI